MDYFKEFLSGLKFDLPEAGLEPPSEEIIVEPPKEEEINGQVLKVTFDVIMFMNHDQSKYFMMQTNQKLSQLGEMTIKEALLKFNKKPPRKRG